MYYKIITNVSWFAVTYKDVDVLDIPYGTVFAAPRECKYQSDDPKIMLGKKCFHFAEGALDTMLWHTWLTHPNKKFQLYRIEPLTLVKKERCRDMHGIYQCGAEKIKILDRPNLDEMYEAAIKEYVANRDRYQNFDINLDLWKKHETTNFCTYQHYDELVAKRNPQPFNLNLFDFSR